MAQRRYVPHRVRDDVIDPFDGVEAIEEIVRQYPIRDSGLCAQVAKTLRFRNAEDYEESARTLIVENAALAETLRELVGELRL